MRSIKQPVYKIAVSICFVIGFFIFVLFSKADVNVFYVATNGNDGNSCATAQNINTPKRTITGGITCLTPGSTLYIRAGTYAEAFTNNIPSGTDWNSPVTIAAYGQSLNTPTGYGPDPAAEVVIMKPSDGDTAGWGRVMHLQDGKHHIIIAGLILDAANLGRTYTNQVVKITGGPDEASTAHHIRLRNNEIRNGPSDCVLESGHGYSHDNEYLNNNVHDCGVETRDQGFYIGGPTNDIIRGNYVHNIAGYGIQIQYDGGSNTIVEGNWSDHNQRGGMVALSDQAGLTIRNNIFSNNPTGLVLAAGHYGNPTKFYNNTFYKNTGSGYYHYFEPPGQDFPTIARNNIFWLNGIDIDNNAAAGVVTLDHNLAGTDPKFVNAAANDFHLQSNSPAINAGVTLAEVLTDKDGATRPSGLAYDIGAYEYGGVVTGTPTPSTLKGDLNNDNIINSLDWSIMNSKWFTNSAVADLNNDGIVNSLDFSIMNGNWLKGG